MASTLFVVSCNHPMIYDMVQRRLYGEPDTEVTLDRRFRQRRRDDHATGKERRRTNRRRHDIDTQLTDLGWAVIQRD
ncbi:MAG TPA: hypothetical protein VGL09_21695 [Methylomirabilota bacterium]|jgi:hypothetical protein